jgi:hypothetical protein
VRLETFYAPWNVNRYVLYLEERKIYLLLAPHLVKYCFPHFTMKLCFQFLPVKGNIWPSLRIYQPWNELGDVISPFGITSGPKPQ